MIGALWRLIFVGFVIIFGLHLAETMTAEPVTAFLLGIPERDFAWWLSAYSPLIIFCLIVTALIGALAWAIDCLAHRNHDARTHRHY